MKQEVLGADPLILCKDEQILLMDQAGDIHGIGSHALTSDTLP